MKKGILTLVTAILVLGFATNVNAATSISIGTNYGDGADSSGEATTAYNKTKSMGYTAYLSTAPTISTISSYAKNFLIPAVVEHCSFTDMLVQIELYGII